MVKDIKEISDKIEHEDSYWILLFLNNWVVGYNENHEKIKQITYIENDKDNYYINHIKSPLLQLQIDHIRNYKNILRKLKLERILKDGN